MYRFGELVAQFRRRERMTQEALAQTVDVTRLTVSNWERGLYVPSTREKVLEVAEALALDESDTDALLLGADYQAQHHLRAPYATDSPEKISISRLPVTGRALFGRDERLQELDSAWDDPSVNVLTLVAWGGIGKTALINHWLSSMGKSNYRGAARVFAWSFYRQGVTELVVSSDSFIDAALRWFDDTDPLRGTAWERGERLAQLVQRTRNLVIIDGLEPLQYPPGRNEGRLKDVALQAFLRELAAFNRGLCVVSTRLPVTDIAQHEQGSCPRLDLHSLSPEAGRQLLRSLNVRGRDLELEQASQEFGGHALALTLLGTYLRDGYRGDIKQRAKVSLLREDKDEGEHAYRVMESYEQWFADSPELHILRVLGLFDRPATEGALSVLRSHSVPHLTARLTDLNDADWRRAVARLRRAHLVADLDPEQPDALDAHPLVREYFGQQLQSHYPDAWHQGNDMLYRYYSSTALPLPDTIEQMEPLYQAIIYACKAGRYREALHDLYLPRVMRGNEHYAAERLGALTALLSVLNYFFQGRDWDKPVDSLGHADRLIVLLEAGRYLTEVVGYAALEVGQCYSAAAAHCDPRHDAQTLFEVLLGLCRYYRLRGQLDKSGAIAHQLYELGEQLGEPSLAPSIYRALATNMYYVGNFTDCDQYAVKGLTTYSTEQEALVSAQRDVNEPNISCMGYRALVRWFLGHPDEARHLIDETLGLARRLAHAHTIAITMLIDSMIWQFCRNYEQAARSAQDLINYCSASGFQLWRIAGEIIYLWGTSHQPTSSNDAPIRISASIDEWFGAGAGLFSPYWYGMLADLYLTRGMAYDGLRAVHHGLEHSRRNGEHWWDAQLLIVKGGLMQLQAVDIVEAKECFAASLEVATKQQAHSLRLRAALGLARLLAGQSDEYEARLALAAEYGWFTEGFSTADLQESAAYLDHCQQPESAAPCSQ